MDYPLVQYACDSCGKLTEIMDCDEHHLRVAFAHRPIRYAKVWNSDLGEEQVIEIEMYDKGGWNIPDVVLWLDLNIPNLEED